MPQPIRRDIHVTVTPGALSTRPALACRIAIISSQWFEIEDEMAMLYAVATFSVPAIAAAVLGCVANLKTRLDMIGIALSLAFPTEIEEAFNKRHKEQIRKRANERNDVIHCHWLVHEDFPDHLLRMRGLADPKLGFAAWSLKDFLEIELRSLQLLVDLKRFAQTLTPYVGQINNPKSFWQPSEPPSGSVEIVHHLRKKKPSKSQ